MGVGDARAVCKTTNYPATSRLQQNQLLRDINPRLKSASVYYTLHYLRADT